MAIQDLAGNYGFLPDYVPETPPPQPMQMASAAPQPAPQAVPPVAPQISPQTGKLDLEGLLSKYQAGATSYGSELAAARGAAARETKAFNDLLEKAMNSQVEQGPSKAEVYFRLASAFGAPTKTGNFFENLGEAGKTLAEVQKQERDANKANRTLKLQLGIEGQKAKMTAAKDDLNTIRALSAEEMKDKRALVTELIKEYVASGKPQSDAGKQAKDMGLTPGTPAYQSKVDELVKNGIDARLAQINATLAGLQLRERESAKLSPAEVKIKTETEDLLGGTDSAMKALKEAYKLNPNTFDNSITDLAQRKILEAAGSTDPKVVNTRVMETLLGEQALSKLRAAFGGNPTEGERKIMLDLQGIGSKSIQERGKIMLNAYEALQASRVRQQRRLNDINAGLYRQTETKKIEE